MRRGDQVSINEKLAELCGKSFVENDGNSFAESCALMGRPMVYEGNGVFKDWNPTTDLNQLKMCYEALNEDELIRFAELTIYAPFDAWVTQTELVAEAILKAKGVS